MPTKKSLIVYPKRGSIYIANLDPALGREMRKKRPILVISENTLNQALFTIVVIPFSSLIPAFVGLDLVVFKKQTGLDKKSVLIVNQLRAIDKSRLVSKAGLISSAKMQEVEAAIRAVLGLVN